MGHDSGKAVLKKYFRYDYSWLLLSVLLPAWKRPDSIKAVIKIVI